MAFTTAECIMFSTLKVFELDPSSNIIGVATGFTMALTSGADDLFPILVTNRHVLSKSAAIALILTRNDGGKPDIGNTKTVTIPTTGAIYHPTDSIDLAILPIGEKVNELKSGGFNPFMSYLDVKLIPTKEQWESFDAIEEVITAGFPKGLRDTVNNVPIIRSGITATHPGFDFTGEPEFLVDMPCFQGCSGSPVFIYNKGVYADSRSGETSIGKTRVFLMGVQRAIQVATKTVEQKTVSDESKEPAPTYEQLLDLGIIIKSTELLAFVDLLRDAGV